MEAGARKRSLPSVANGGAVPASKRSKEMDGVGSKLKPCNKFFSISGCPFGENCHFLHYVPGGYQAVSKMNLASQPVGFSGAAFGNPSPVSDVHASNLKTRLCNKYNTAEGCKFGDKCRFAHGERELSKPVQSFQEATARPHMGGMIAGGSEPSHGAAGAPANFGASATAKISVDASLAGAIIGKGGVNTKQICRVTGAKLCIRDNESDSNLKNIELEGTFDQIQQASAMVSELIGKISANMPIPAKTATTGNAPLGASNFYKTKLCEKFAKGSCTFGERCHFAHGAAELRKEAT